MLAALAPVLRAACQDIVDAPLPVPIARRVQELALREPATHWRERQANERRTPRIHVNIFHRRTNVANAIARRGKHSGHMQKAPTKTIVSKPSAMPAR
jgi:hypothetical protein